MYDTVIVTVLYLISY